MTYDPSFHPSMPQQIARTGSDWSPREYWVDPPKIIPPAPPFNKWVPAPDMIAFAEAPRDPSRYQSLTGVNTQGAPTPIPPKPSITAPQHNARPDWTLRDYSANQDRFSVLATPLLPPITGPNPPQQNARPDWTLQQYASNQDRFSWMFPNTNSLWVPAADVIAFGELPRDMTALRSVLAVNVLAKSPPSSRPPLLTPVTIVPVAARDLTAERWVIEANKATYLAIPLVPCGEVVLAFEDDPIDMTPYNWVLRPVVPPKNPPPQIPPSAVPYIQPPGWALSQYQSGQDQFSALATPTAGVYPKGLRPTFTVEALLREIPRATPVYQNYILPKVPPFQFAQPLAYIEPPDWTLNQYRQIQDQFSALLAAQPIPVGFRCRAVTAGMYGGQYYWPGDVFDILFAADFSDATKNYEAAGNEYAPGWMVKVPSTTPLFQTITSQIYPMFPPVDPNRRFIL